MEKQRSQRLKITNGETKITNTVILSLQSPSSAAVKLPHEPTLVEYIVFKKSKGYIEKLNSAINGNNTFVSKEHHTPRQIAKSLGVDVAVLVKLNIDEVPGLHRDYKLAKGTNIKVPDGVLPDFSHEYRHDNVPDWVGATKAGDTGGAALGVGAIMAGAAQVASASINAFRGQQTAAEAMETLEEAMASFELDDLKKAIENYSLVVRILRWARAQH